MPESYGVPCRLSFAQQDLLSRIPLVSELLIHTERKHRMLANFDTDLK